MAAAGGKRRTSRMGGDARGEVRWATVAAALLGIPVVQSCAPPCLRLCFDPILPIRARP